MARFVFKGMAVVTGVTITVEAVTLGEAIGQIARDEGAEVDLEPGSVEYTWADLNSGTEEKEQEK